MRTVVRLAWIASLLGIAVLQSACISGCGDGGGDDDDTPDPPIITSVSPPEGIVGQEITVNGLAFGSSAGLLTLGGMTVTPDSWAEEQITFTIPAAAYPGPREIRVTTEGGMSSVDFRVTLPACVYANENDSPNRVRGWTVASNGTMTEITGSPWATGDDATSYVGAVNSIRVNLETRRLFAGSLSSVAAWNIDAVTCELTAYGSSPFFVTAPSGSSYGSLDVTPDGEHVYFADAGNDLVRLLVDTGTGAFLEPASPTAVISEAATIDMRPNGVQLYVQEESNFFEAFSPGKDFTLVPLDGSPFSLDTANGIGGGFVSAMSPSGAHWAIGTENGVAIYALDVVGQPALVPGSPQEQWPSDQPGGVAFSGDGAFAYVGVFSSGSLATFDVTTAPVTEAAGSPFTGLIGTPGVMSSMAASSDGRFLFVAKDNGYVYTLSLGGGVPIAILDSSTQIAPTSGLAATF